MNRTILIVICDFLLVSLLAFSTVDISKPGEQAAARANLSMTAHTAATNHIGGRQDLGDVMRLALEEERKKQDALSVELSQTRLTASQQLALLNQRSQQLQTYEQQLRARDAQAQQLLTAQTNLTQQVTAAQNNISNLSQQLRASSVITTEQRAAQEAEIRKQEDKAAQLRAQLAALEKNNQQMAAQREQLAHQLQQTEADRKAAAAQLSQAQEDLTAQRQQNAKLQEGVKVLAGQSSALAQEIRSNRQLAPNTIFNDFSSNRVSVTFNGTRPGFFGGDAAKNKQTDTILVTDGTNIYALCHLQDTLLTLWNPAVPWEQLSGTMSRGTASFQVPSMSFYLADPRVVFMPVTPEMAHQLGCKVYHFAADPFKFQDAVVVGAREGYYGECNFQIDLSAPQYLKMDHNSLKGLFGKFNPSTGDLVFSKNGDLLGVMANNTYCIIMRNFDSAATFRFGPDARGQPIAETLASLYATVTELPFKLQ